MAERFKQAAIVVLVLLALLLALVFAVPYLAAVSGVGQAVVL